MRAETQQSFAVVTGLACLFAGIWTSDPVIVDALDPQGDDLAMRMVSLILYALMALAVAIVTARGSAQRRRRRNSLRYDGALGAREDIERSANAKPGSGSAPFVGPRFLVKSIAAGVGLFTCGCVALVASGGLAGAIVAEPVAVGCLVLLKSIGAPVSIALVCLCARLPYRLVVGTGAGGMIGAFVANGALGIAFAITGVSAEVRLAVGAGLIAAASAITLCVLLRSEPKPYGKSGERGEYGTTTVGETTRIVTPAGGKIATDRTATVANDPSSRQPLRAIFGRNLAVGLVVASMMLGFVRAGFSAANPYIQPVTLVALVLIGALAVVLPRAGLPALFRGALVTTAAAFLLNPLLGLVSFAAPALLTGIGTALFEAVVWIAAALCARECTASLLAAAVARLAIVAGHLIGALLAWAAALWSAAEPGAADTISLAIVFIYLVLLLLLFTDPWGSLPLPTGGAKAETARNSSPRTALIATSDELLWKLPCAAIAADCGLTPRETEVLEQLAQGRDLAYMEEKFVLSRNTIKMHIKHIYAKLGVHSKQEVIDRVEAARR